MSNERHSSESLQLNLGSLRSAMSLTLHTQHASRIWHGRAPTEGRAGIIGLNGFISAMKKMKRSTEDRQSVMKGKRVSGSVDLGGRGIINNEQEGQDKRLRRRTYKNKQN